MLGNGGDFAHIGIERTARCVTASAWRAVRSQRAVHHEIGITPNRTGEMQIIRLGQSIVTERLRSVACAFQTFEQSDLESLLFGLSTECGKQPLQLHAMGQIADLVVKAKHEFAILCEFLRVWIFVNTIDSGNREILEFTCDSLICRQHELFDKLLRFIDLNALYSHLTYLIIYHSFDLCTVVTDTPTPLL